MRSSSTWWRRCDGSLLGGALPFLRPPLVCPDGVVGDLGRVAAAHQGAPGAVALPFVMRRELGAALEQQQGGFELGRVAAVAYSGLDQVGRDAAPVEVAGDALASPALELALVLG